MTVDDLRRLSDCPCCGQPVWTAPSCGCSHSVLVHDINGANERTRCLTAEGVRGKQCECKRFEEAA